jgi:hypothetical protein
MTTLQGNVYQKPASYMEFFDTNRMDPWWVRTPHVTLVNNIQIYTIFYLIFAYTEVLSYYLTGYDNNGKFPVKYSRAKQYFMYAFYSTLALYLFLYLAMVFFVIVWALLAAILNPSVFLPYTAAALALLGTFSAKLLHYKAKFESMKQELLQVI